MLLFVYKSAFCRTYGLDIKHIIIIIIRLVSKTPLYHRIWTVSSKTSRQILFLVFSSTQGT